MASIPKPTAVATAAPVHSARAVGPSARVASISTSQVDALENGTNISFDAAASGFQHEQNHSHSAVTVVSADSILTPALTVCLRPAVRTLPRFLKSTAKITPSGSAIRKQRHT